MALFGRDRLPARSTLSRFLAALTPEPVEALRALFLTDGLSRPLGNEKQTGGLWDRAGTHWLVFDVDGTREAARQRALPRTPDRPPAQRRLRPLCAPGYTGRKRGEVVRTRTVVSQAHSYQWLGSFGNPGNGHYREELRRAVMAIHRYLSCAPVPAGMCPAAPGWTVWHWSRSRRSRWPRLCHARQRLSDARSKPRSRLACTCPPISNSLILKVASAAPSTTTLIWPWGRKGSAVGSVVATHPASEKKSRIGV